MSELFLVGAVASVIVGTPAVAANLITNGSFDNGLSGRTVTTTGGGTAPRMASYGGSINANTVASLSLDAVGTSVAYVSPDTANPHTLSQTVNLIRGGA